MLRHVFEARFGSLHPATQRFLDTRQKKRSENLSKRRQSAVTNCGLCLLKKTAHGKAFGPTAPSKMSRLPMLSHARDSDFWRQRIHKEQKAGDRALAFDVTWNSGFGTPRTPRAFVNAPGLTPRLPVAPFAASPRSDQLVSRSPFLRPQTVATEQSWRATPTLLPRSPELSMALQKGWTEPPLIMARGFAEPPRVFRKYLEASTHSVHKPPAPVLNWKH